MTVAGANGQQVDIADRVVRRPKDLANSGLC